MSQTIHQTTHRRAFLKFAASTSLLVGAAKAMPADAFAASTKERVNIRHELIIGAAAEKIYSAITSPEGLSAWWTPDVKAKPERGSIARFAFGPDYFKEMKITELDPVKHVKWICITGVDEWVGTSISFMLHAGNRDTLLNSHPEAEDQIQQQRNRAEQTLLILSHDDWRGYSPMFAECNYTWGQFLRSLKLLCETGKGRPWPYQHSSES